MTSQVPCADFGTNDEKLIEYLSKYKIVPYSADSFIDFDEVDPFKGPVKYSVKFTETLSGKKLLAEPGTKNLN